MTSRIGVSVCGAVALVVLARAATYYAHTDALALALVLAMTVALVGAMLELLGRVSRADRLTRELAALPRPATQASIDGASAAMQPLLRARLSNATGSIGSAPLAGYVVGLLVMLGLLGTFLGLFETLRGAREALTSSGDVEALRASLGAPMQGLTRSFGTSAAGVSASAMLGLAAALVRQTESRFGAALAQYASGALAPLTAQGRQLAALEKLAVQGEALPRAVAALDAAAVRLTSLESSWGTAHADAAKAASDAIRGAVERVAVEFQHAVVQAASAAEVGLAPIVTRAVEGSVAVAKQHVVDLAARLDRDLEARKAEDAVRTRKQDEAFAKLAKSEEARAEVLASRWTDATRSLEAAIAASEARGQSRDEAFARSAGEIAKAAQDAIASAGEHLTQADARGAAHAAQLDAMIAAIEAQRTAAAASVDEQRAAVDALLAGAAERAEAFDARARDGHAALLADVRRGLAEQVTRAEALDAQTRAGHAALVAEVQRGIADHATHTELLDTGTREGHAALVAEIQRGVAEHAKRTEALDDQTRAGHATLVAEIQRGMAEQAARAEALDAQARAGHSSLVAELQRGMAEQAARAEAFDTQTREGHGALVAEIQRAMAEQAARAESLDTQTRAGQSALVAELQKGIAEQAARAESLDAQTRAGQSALVTELQKGIAEQATRAEALDAQAHAGHASLLAEVQRSMAEQSARAEALDERAREGHAALLAEVQRGVAEHAARAVALEGDVGAALALQAERLVAIMTTHTEGREAQLDAVAARVGEAVGGIQSGGAELVAVAEMFASAVDRHREGAQEWLAALGTVEGAIARAADEVAGGALNEQLDRARELFDTQLHFHREMLMQLRGVHLAAADTRLPRQDEDAPA